jgi:FHA domain
MGSSRGHACIGRARHRALSRRGKWDALQYLPTHRGVRNGAGAVPNLDGFPAVENSNGVTLLSEYRQRHVDGELEPIEVPVLLVGMRGNGRATAAEFRTSTRQGVLARPQVEELLLDEGASLAPLTKSDRNPYDNFIFVGRASTCDVIFRDASVSKSHAVFERDDARVWRLRDNGSHNGTWVDGRRLAPKTRVPVASGHAIVFGAYPAYLIMPDDLRRILETMPDVHA